MPGTLLLGIDVGTTWCKAAVVDTEGRERSTGRARTPWVRVTEGTELDPSELERAVEAAANDALRLAPEGPIAAVGVASMAET
ncbi:MAG TPA: carbohydrate kinase, partial [Candidatus Dormibacteraeota bacterium]|nr:carbohydrate kinase [Candidatus Dormibacteraeota bacterium]